MSSEKRLVLFLVLTIGSMWGITTLMDALGLNPPPVKPAAAVAKKDEPAKAAGAEGAEKPAPTPAEIAKAQDDAMPADPFAPADPPKTAEVAATGPKRIEQPLVLGAEDGYRLEVRLDQRGASVALATSKVYEGEIDPAAARKGLQEPRLVLIRQNPRSEAPWPLALTVTSAAKAPAPAEETSADPRRVEAGLYEAIWEVVRTADDAPYIRGISKVDPKTKASVEGQEVAFRSTVADPSVVVTKTYRIWKGEDGFEVELKFGGEQDANFSYTLVGPYGIPIEGDWYTTTFRDVFFGQVKDGVTEVSTRPASEVVTGENDPAQRFSMHPIKFAGVEDQYFATFLQPWPIPRANEDRWDHDSGAFVVLPNPKEPQKADVGVEIVSKPIRVGRNLGEVTHTYKVFAGPKSAAALAPYEADDLTSYRKNQWFSIPFAATLAKGVIAPLLGKIYALTESVAHLFGGKKGNYGIAIILLTMTVRLIMFPLGRKQAVMAKKMQDLQPLLNEVREKYKDDKEQLNKETWAVFRANKVNPASGCLPALIQLPIFVGLWQALNNSVELRHSSFLYIRDLAAPDMLFKFPFELPLLGQFLGPYFNLLPLLVVALMLVQTKLFSPPATTPEAEMNQKMMKYMMVFMAFMFYKVPSGLGLYFITSSLWQISERLLLPKILPIRETTLVKGNDPDFGGPGGDGRGPGGGNGRGPGGNGRGPAGQPPASKGWLGQKLEKLMEEAAKEKTIRNDDRDRVRERERDNRSRPRPGKKR